MKSVLLLDDDQDLCSVMHEMLEDLGMKTVTCINSFEELKQMHKGPTHLCWMRTSKITGDPAS